VLSELIEIKGVLTYTLLRAKYLYDLKDTEEIFIYIYIEENIFLQSTIENKVTNAKRNKKGSYFDFEKKI
jgi:hypothetical protein